MKRNNILIPAIKFFFLGVFLLTFGCKRQLVDLQPATYPVIANVFVNGFASDLAYAAFGGSYLKAFTVDSQTTYNNTTASIRIGVPNANSPEGSYAGGVFYSTKGRNLTSFNALTFYIKASQPATIGVIGFGNDLGPSSYQVTLNNLVTNTNWQKVIIPIPDPSRLVAEKGMLFYSVAPINGSGFTFWIDDVTFENVTNLAHVKGFILTGQTDTIKGAQTGDTTIISGCEANVNLPTGVNQLEYISPNYFSFSASDNSVASITAAGDVSVLNAGTTTITATLANQPAVGSLKIISTGPAIMPLNAPPSPTKNPANVISLRTSVYPNWPVVSWNPHWLYSTTQNTYVTVANDSIIRYRYLNFVGIDFSSPTINANNMEFFHMDIWTPDNTNPPNNFQMTLVDFGANGVYGGGDDVQSTITVTSPTLVTKNWVSFDIPFSKFVGLTTRAHLAQLVLAGTLADVYIDNVYFYNNPLVPTAAAPTPTIDSANVFSIFSNTYTNVPGTNFNPSSGQATTVTQTLIGGKNTLVYSGLNFQDIQLAANQNVSSYGFLHLDYYTEDANSLKLYLQSANGAKASSTLSVPTPGWNSVDIPLSAFYGVDLTKLSILMFVGTGDVYLGNIFFWKIPLVPQTAAPSPTYPASSVISIFSSAYTNVPGTNYFPNWGQATTVAQTSIGGVNTLVYTNLNFEGTQFGSTQNVSAMNYLHVDYYTPNAVSLQVYLISTGPQQIGYNLNVPTGSGWGSVDIPLSQFTPTVDLTNLIQMMFQGNGTIYLENIYFHQ